MRIATVVLMVLAAFWCGAQAAPKQKETTIYATPGPMTTRGVVDIPHTLDIINQEGSVVVSISAEDGKITFGKGIKPDEAAKQFWNAVTNQFGVVVCPDKTPAPASKEKE